METSGVLKACHYVRDYVRFRFGRIEHVRGHWRCC